MKRVPRSLIFWMTVPCLIAVCATWAGYTAFWVAKYDSEAQTRFEESGRRAADLFAEALSDALWEFDQNAAERILEGLEEWHGFSNAVIYDSSGVFASARDLAGPEDAAYAASDGTHQSPMWKEGSIVYFFSEIEHSAHGQLGHLVAAFDTKPLETQLWATRREALSAALLGFALIGVLLIAIARSVTRPFVDMTNAVDKVAAGDLDVQVPSDQKVDEVRRLASSLDVFQRNAARLVYAKAEAAANRRVAELAMIDDLTGLSNRRAVAHKFEALEQEPKTLKSQNITILHLDLDGFKQINDTLGHKAGDYVLEQVAKRLKQNIDYRALVARVGGDEFVVMLEQKRGGTHARALAESLVTVLAEPILFEEQEMRIGVSIGLARHDATRESLYDTLLHADIALYRAKARGKGCVVEFTEEHRRDVNNRKKLSEAISSGIDKGQFIPFFQPIVAAGTHEVVAVEMLARWQHPEEGILAPNRFLQVATDLNLMRLIDRQVLDLALAHFTRWASEGIHLPRLCINVSATRLLEQDFFDTVSHAQQEGIDIDLELLEMVFLDEPPEQLLWQLDRLRDMGMGLHIDDFGTGHASIAGLLKIQPDKVKIDRQFVLPALENPRAKGLVTTLIGICRELDIDAVGEGVETLPHAILMEELGCPYLQGHAFSHPIPAQDLHELLRKRPGRKAI